MDTLPLAYNVVLSAALATVIGVAFFGPPPLRPAPRGLIEASAAAGVGLWVWGLIGTYSEQSRAGAALALGVIALSWARWLARAPAGGDDEPGDDPPGEPEPPPDWDAFDRLRRGWDHPREPVA